jgi:CRISPR-associated endonuclease/helicase Cas3
METVREKFAKQVVACAVRLHQEHREVDPRSGKQVSFGLVRMANINPLFDVALELYRLGAPENHRIHLCVYHSQYPLLTRSAIEHRLDSVLDRRKPAAVFDLPEIRSVLAAHDELNQLFIVLSSPITEVGRDHDYDWAVVEPSSMRSLIQLAGRVRRHRKTVCETINLLIFDQNLRSIERHDQPAYIRPGFESAAPEFRLATHVLSDLLREEERTIIDARPRIFARTPLQTNLRLADLEHARLDRLMHEPQRRQLSERERRNGIQDTPSLLSAYSWWVQPKSILSGVLQQEQPFRKQSQQEVDLILLPNEDGDDYKLCYLLAQKKGQAIEVPIELAKNHRISDLLLEGMRIQPWGDPDFMLSLTKLAEELDLDLATCARRFATVTLPELFLS